MKKILRLVTTSVLTLTLVACGEASSSVSSSVNTGNGSVPNVSSAYANVTSVTLSAATATLTQVMGAQRRVTVTAALNANTNPNLTLEWYVNGVKQAQISRIFDFTPTEAGSFAIQAKIGNLSSNTLTVTATNPVLVIESAEFVKGNVIEVEGTAGANVVLVGATLADTSFYSIAEGKYVLNLVEPVAKGGRVTVRLEKQGFQTLTQEVVYDVGKFTLSSLTIKDFAADTAYAGVAAGGTYKIVKPFDSGASFVKTYNINLSQVDVIPLVGTVTLVQELTVPAGAVAVPTSTQLVDSISAFPFNVTNTTVAGLYVHKFTLDGKTVEVKVMVEEPKAAVEIANETYSHINLVTGGNTNYEFVFRKDLNGNGVFTDAGEAVPVTKDASGAYVVEKLNHTFDFAEFEFRVLASSFAKPEFAKNQMTVTVAGPDLFGTVGQLFAGINTAYPTNLNQTALGTTAVDFAGATLSTFEGAVETSHARLVSQKIDYGTPSGTYTFTIKAGEFGKEVSKDVVVKIINPVARLDFVLENLTSGGITDIAADVAPVLSPAVPVKVGTVVQTSPDVYEITKPLNAESTLSLPWFTVLTNYQSEVVKDFTQVSNDNLLTDLNLRKYWSKESKIKLTDANLNSADYLVKRGEANVAIFAEVVFTTLGTKDITVTETESANGGTKISKPGAVAAVGTDVATINVSAATAINTKYLVQIANITTTSSTLVGAKVSYAIAATGSNTAISAITDIVVMVTDFPDVLELGSQEFTDASIADVAGVQGIAANSFNFVNVSLATTGPATLVKPLPTTRAAIRLGANDDTATPLAINATNAFGTDGLVLFQGGNSSVSTVAAMETRFEKYLNDNNVQRYNAFGATTRTFAYNLDHLGAAQADITREFANNLETGLKRNALEIKSTTVAGSYTLTFTVDNLVKNVTLVVKNPQPEISILTRTDNLAGTNKIAYAAATAETQHYRLSGPLSSLLEYNTAKFASPNADGTYTVERTVNDYLKAEIAIFNLPIGRYNYSISKKYPDGRVENNNDIAFVTRLDQNGRSLFEQTSAGTYRNSTVSAADSALNASLLTRWFINTADTTELNTATLQLGTYEYTFTMGTFSRKFVINVIDAPALDFSSVEIDGTALNLLNGVYYVDANSARGRLTVNFKKLNLPASVFVKVSALENSASLTVVADPLALGTTYLTLSSQTTLDLNRIAGAIPSVGSHNIIQYTFEFFKRVDFDSPENTAGTAAGRFVKIAAQTLEIRAMTAVSTPTSTTVLTGWGNDVKTFAVTTVNAERVYWTVDGSTPNLNSEFVDVTTNGTAANISVPANSAGKTLKIIAVSAGFKNSDVASFNLLV
jgi:hypothetical protein